MGVPNLGRTDLFGMENVSHLIDMEKLFTLYRKKKGLSMRAFVIQKAHVLMTWHRVIFVGQPDLNLTNNNLQEITCINKALGQCRCLKAFNGIPGGLHNHVQIQF